MWIKFDELEKRPEADRHVWRVRDVNRGLDMFGRITKYKQDKATVQATFWSEPFKYKRAEIWSEPVAWEGERPADLRKKSTAEEPVYRKLDIGETVQKGDEFYGLPALLTGATVTERTSGAYRRRVEFKKPSIQDIEDPRPQGIADAAPSWAKHGGNPLGFPRICNVTSRPIIQDLPWASPVVPSGIRSMIADPNPDQELLDAWTSSGKWSVSSTAQQNQEPKPEDGYFLLEDGDTILEGDEMFFNGRWRLSPIVGGLAFHFGGENAIPFRRKMEEGYRLLEDEEFTKAGDEYLDCFGGWKIDPDDYCCGLKVSDTCFRFRRKTESSAQDKAQYKVLAVGDVIQKGDERLHDGEWRQVSEAFGLLEIKVEIPDLFRRRVEAESSPKDLRENPSISAGEGYFLLVNGDQIQEGDEFFAEHREWKEAYAYLSGRKWNAGDFVPFRRKVEDGYRMLEEGEAIQRGDEIMDFDGKWSLSEREGGGASPAFGQYRRKISPPEQGKNQEYFFLKVLDRILKGDEIVHPDGICTVRADAGTHWKKDFFPVRRKIEKGWRILEDGSIIEKGDEYLGCRGVWKKITGLVGEEGYSNLVYRRKVDTEADLLADLKRVEADIERAKAETERELSEAEEETETLPEWMTKLGNLFDRLDADCYRILEESATDLYFGVLGDPEAEASEEWRYVLLKEGEEIEEGDEFYSQLSAAWVPSVAPVRSGWRIRAESPMYRRKVYGDPLDDEGEEECNITEEIFEVLSTVLSVLSDMQNPSKRHQFELARSMACLRVAEAIQAVRLLKEDEHQEEEDFLSSLAELADKYNEGLSIEKDARKRTTQRLRDELQKAEAEAETEEEDDRWRYLEEGEVIEEGDEFLFSDGTWNETKRVGEEMGNLGIVYRRKV